MKKKMLNWNGIGSWGGIKNRILILMLVMLAFSIRRIILTQYQKYWGTK